MEDRKPTITGVTREGAQTVTEYSDGETSTINHSAEDAAVEYEKSVISMVAATAEIIEPVAIPVADTDPKPKSSFAPETPGETAQQPVGEIDPPAMGG